MTFLSISVVEVSMKPLTSIETFIQILYTATFWTKSSKPSWFTHQIHHPTNAMNAADVQEHISQLPNLPWQNHLTEAPGKAGFVLSLMFIHGAGIFTYMNGWFLW